MADDIGDVSVDVIADASDFEKKLRAKLKAISEKLRANIKATVDTKLAAAQGAALRKTLEKTISIPATISKASQAGFAEVAFRLKKELAAAASLPAIAPQIASYALERVKEQIRTIPGIAKQVTANIVTAVETKLASAEMKAWLATQRKNVIEVGVRIRKSTLTAISSQLKAISGVTAIKNEITGFSNAIKGFFENLPGIARGITKFASLGSLLSVAIASLAVSLAAVGPAVQGLGAALLAIPGILAGLGASIAVIVVALKDAPNVVRNATKSFNGLRKVISSNFWAQAQDATTAFLKQLGPQVKAGMAGVSADVGGVVGSLLSSLSKQLNNDVVAGIFTNIANGAKALQPAMAPLASILKMLLQFGTSLLPGISAWIVDITLRFNEWLANAMATGALNESLKTLGVFLRDLGAGFAAIGGIISGISTAALAAGIGGIGGGLQRISEVVNSPAFQETLTLFFVGAAGAVDGLLTALGPIGTMLQSLMPQISGFLTDIGVTFGSLIGEIATAMSGPVFKEGLGQFFEGILGFLQPLIPVMPIFVEKLAEIGALGGTVLSTLGPLFASALTAIVPVLTNLFAAVDPLIKALGPALTTVIETLGPVLADLVKDLTPVFTVITDLLPIVAGLVAELISGFAPILGEVAGLASMLVTALAPLVTTLLSALMPIVSALAPVFSALIGAIMPLITTVLGVLMPILTPLINLFVMLLNIALEPTITVLNILAGVFAAIGPILQILAEVIGAVINTIVALFEGDMTKVGEIWSSTWDSIVGIWDSTIGPFFEGIGTFFSELWTNVVNTVTTAINLVAQVISSVSSAIATAWNNTWTGVKSAFENALSGLGSFFTGIANGVLSGIGTLVNGAIDLINGIIGGVNTISATVGIDAIPKLGKISVPQLALGATILPRRGGTLANLGEGGRAESVVDTGLMNKMLNLVLREFPKQLAAVRATARPADALAAAAAGNSTSMTNNFPVPEGADPAEVAQEFVNRLAEKAGL